MNRVLAICLAMTSVAACSKPTELASSANGKGSITVAAAPKNTIAIKIALAGFTAGHQALVDAAAKIKN